MKKGIIGRKLGMTQLFTETGDVVAVTLIEAGPCPVVQKKGIETDGYNAVQLGFDNLKPSRVNKPMAGHFKKADVAPKRRLQEFRFDDISAYKPGDLIKADVFSEGELVDVSATSKGKGFAGVIKRHGAHRLKESHGSGPVVRNAGSMSGASDPSRIFKGKKMPGHMGGVKVTVQNLQIVKVDVENDLIAVKGAVPGPNGVFVSITDGVKAKKNITATAKEKK